MFLNLFATTTLALSLGRALAAVQFKGVNIAGFDYGCSIDGTCVKSSAYPALTQLHGSDGAGQMAHFTKTHGFNMYRLPVGWQYLVNDVLGGNLDPKNSADYDLLVQACLVTSSHCLIDIHNYARWNGGIIGQGGPTNEQFANLWSQLATKYASESKIVFGLMNEPHDVPDMNLWAGSVQAAVTAIRTAGATSQIILLPGNDYTSAESFVSGGSAAALSTVKNIDGTFTNLVFDVHKYLDSDGSGTHAECVSSQIDTSFSPLATYLRANNRQALLSETGGASSNADCMTYVCQALRFLDSNSDVYLGYIGWAAGAFGTDYILSVTPFGSAAEGWTDQKLVSCFAQEATGSSSSASSPSSSTSTTASATLSTATTTLGVNTTLSVTPSASSTAPSSAALTSTTAMLSPSSTTRSSTSTPNPSVPTSSFSTPTPSSSTSSFSWTYTSTPWPTPWGFTTLVRPSSTESAGAEATGDGGDDDTCDL